jgi:hypothetical protein
MYLCLLIFEEFEVLFYLKSLNPFWNFIPQISKITTIIYGSQLWVMRNEDLDIKKSDAKFGRV